MEPPSVGCYEELDAPSLNLLAYAFTGSNPASATIFSPQVFRQSKRVLHLATMTTRLCERMGLAPASLFWVDGVGGIPRVG